MGPTGWRQMHIQMPPGLDQHFFWRWAAASAAPLWSVGHEQPVDKPTSLDHDEGAGYRSPASPLNA